MVNIWTWSTTAATNSNADSGINWSEGQLPPTVNDSARAMMQRVAQLLKDIGGVNTTTGTANAQLLAPTGTWNSNTDGRRCGFTAGFTNTGTMTLNISSQGAATVYLNNAALTGGEVVAGGHYEVVYHSASGSRLAGFHLISGKQAVLAGTAASTIVVTDNVNAALRVTQLGTGNTVLFEDSANPDASPWLIDGNGVQVKGHTAALTTLMDWAGTVRTAGTQNHALNYADSMHGLTIWPGAVAGGPTFIFGKTRGGAVGTYTVVASGDTLGAINFEGADGTDFALGAQILGKVDGTPGSGDMPGRIEFLTSPDGSETPAVALTIKSTGQTVFKQGSTTAAGINLGAAASAAPGTPADGDHWWDANGVNWRISGSTRAFNANLWSMSGLTLAAGDTFYATGAGAVTDLAIGTAKQRLTVNAGGTAPEWVSAEWVLVSTNTPAGGAAAEYFTFDWTTYSHCFVEVDCIGAAVGLTSHAVGLANAGSALAGARAAFTLATYGFTQALADRFGAHVMITEFKNLTTDSKYVYLCTGWGWGYDVGPTPTFYAQGDSAAAGSTTRQTQIYHAWNGSTGTASIGEIRIYGRRRTF